VFPKSSSKSSEKFHFSHSGISEFVADSFTLTSSLFSTKVFSSFFSSSTLGSSNFCSKSFHKISSKSPFKASVFFFQEEPVCFEIKSVKLKFLSLFTIL
jgi:hypothetical protein